MKRPKVPQNVITFAGIFAVINLLEIVVLYVYFNANKEPILDFNTSIGIIALLLGIPALIIASVTLAYAYRIRKSEMESKEKSTLAKKNVFEFSLRAFFVEIMWSQRTDLQIPEQREQLGVKITDLQSLFGNLRTTFYNYDLTNFDIFGSLTQIEMTLNSMKIENITQSNYTRHLNGIEDRLNAIAIKYGFNPLEV